MFISDKKFNVIEFCIKNANAGKASNLSILLFQLSILLGFFWRHRIHKIQFLPNNWWLVIEWLISYHLRHSLIHLCNCRYVKGGNYLKIDISESNAPNMWWFIYHNFVGFMCWKQFKHFHRAQVKVSTFRVQFSADNQIHVRHLHHISMC